MIPDSDPPSCPTCQAPLKKPPRAKTKCRACGAFLYVRARPMGGRWLLREDEIAGVEAEWAAAPPRPSSQTTYVGIVGESYRQDTIRRLARVGADVHLIPEPENPHDRHAIKVCLATGEQLGYMDRERAEEMSTQLREGWRFGAFIARTTGGTPDKPSRGVVLRLIEAPPHWSEADLGAALEEEREQERAKPDEWTTRTEENRVGVRLGVDPPGPRLAERRSGCLTLLGLALALAGAGTVLARCSGRP